MRERLLLASNLALFSLATLLLASIQSSLWFQVFGWFPAPVFWFPALIYVSLYRAPIELLAVVFLMSLVLSTMSVMPDSLLFISIAFIAISVRIVKERFYWPGSGYFMLVSGVATLGWHLLAWVGSIMISDVPTVMPAVLDWVLQALLTPLIAPLLLPLFRWFDDLSKREQPAEASADTL